MFLYIKIYILRYELKHDNIFLFILFIKLIFIDMYIRLDVIHSLN